MELTLEQRIKHLYGCCTDPEYKDIIAELFKDILVVIDPYGEACYKLNITPKLELSDDTDPDLLYADAAYRLAICIRAKNMVDGKIWAPNYDGTESHHWPDFKVIKDASGPSGLGLAFDCTYHWHTYTGVGARLEYHSDELARQGATEFKKYYTRFMIYQPK